MRGLKDGVVSLVSRCGLSIIEYLSRSTYLGGRSYLDALRTTIHILGLFHYIFLSQEQLTFRMLVHIHSWVEVDMVRFYLETLDLALSYWLNFMISLNFLGSAGWDAFVNVGLH